MLAVVAVVFHKNVAPGVAFAVNTAGLPGQLTVADVMAVTVGVTAAVTVTTAVLVPQLLVPATVKLVGPVGGVTTTDEVNAPLLQA